MQFLPSTWQEWGITAFGEPGPPNVMDPYDAVPSAARYLCAAGAGTPAGLPRAILAYNHADLVCDGGARARPAVRAGSTADPSPPPAEPAGPRLTLLGRPRRPDCWLDGRMADYDAFVLVSFGGPEGPADVMPFLENVTRGRGVPRERLAEVAHHYDQFGGVSPINQQCRDLLAAIEKDFAASGLNLPLYWGNRNWRPYLADTVARDGRGRRAPRDRVRDLGVRLLLELPAVPRRHRGAHGRRRARPRRGSTRSGTSSTTPASSAPSPRPPWRPSSRCRPAPGPVPRWCSRRTACRSRWRRPAGRTAACTRRSWPRRRGWWPRVSPPAWWRAAVAARLPEPERPAVGAVARPGRLRSPRRACPPSGAPGAVMVPVGFVSDHLEVLLRPRRGSGAGWPAARPPAGPRGHPGTHPRFVSMITELVRERAGKGRRGVTGARGVGGSAQRTALGGMGPGPDSCPDGMLPSPACGHGAGSARGSA